MICRNLDLVNFFGIISWFRLANFFRILLFKSFCFYWLVCRERMWPHGRDPFNQTFRKFRSKTQWIGSVQPEKFRKTGPPFEVVLFSRSDRLEFWLNGSRPMSSPFWFDKHCHVTRVVNIWQQNQLSRVSPNSRSACFGSISARR